MANIAELIEDIEKRMKALGYDDLEELYSPDHDVKSLAVLKRRLMDEAREKRELKKELTKWTKAFRDIIVKISKVYRKDFYIYNSSFLIPGKLSEDGLKGKFILSMKEEYKICMEQILNEDCSNGVLYIRDISELKTVIDENPENKDAILSVSLTRRIIERCDEILTEKIKSKMDFELEKIKEDSSELIPLEVDDNPDIVELKQIFEIKFKDFPPIVGNIQLFPFFTEKVRPDIEYMCGEFESNKSVDLYYARFHIDYEYFDIDIKIFFF